MMKDYLYGTRAPESILRSWLRGMLLAATTLLFISALLVVASFPVKVMADEDELEEIGLDIPSDCIFLKASLPIKS